MKHSLQSWIMVLAVVGFLSTTFDVRASSITFREHTYDFDGGPRTDYVAKTSGLTITYRPLGGWRFLQTGSGGVFEDEQNPYGGQVRFQLKSAPAKAAPKDLEEEAIEAWFKSFLPANAENVTVESLRLGFKRFLEGSLSSCQMDYEVEGRSISLKIWVYPVDSSQWLCITYLNAQGSDFSKYVSRVQNSLNVLSVNEN